MNRRHDIDALRALAFALVILYHVAMYYVAGWGWHLKSPYPADWLQWPMRALNLWRMDLVFLVSGLALGFLRRGSTPLRPLALLGRRSVRLLLPLAFGMAVIVPFQPYAQAVANGSVAPGFGPFLLRYYSGGPWPAGAFDGWDFGVTWNHLWYLPYLWLYTAALALLLPALESPAGRRLQRALLSLRGGQLLLAPVLPLLAYSTLLWPHFPVTHDLVHDGWVHAVYFSLFLYGWWIGTDAGFWAEATRLRWPALGLALLALAALIGLRNWQPLGDAGIRQAGRWLADFYLWFSLLAILGWAHLKLNRPWPWLAWANESVYPWYILHQTIIIALIVVLAPLQLHPLLEAAMLSIGTVGGCWTLTAAIRRSRWLRPLFGLRAAVRPKVPARCPSPAMPASPPARNA